MIEALAQTAALLAFLTLGQKPDDSAVVYFVGIDGARFKRPVEPGDQLVMEVEIVRQSRGIWKFQAKAMVDQQLAVEAELMCTMRSISEPEPVASA
jgi:3-hydroxyacyl-[acyl-carrier-protein] dehydratase